MCVCFSDSYGINGKQWAYGSEGGYPPPPQLIQLAPGINYTLTPSVPQGNAPPVYSPIPTNSNKSY